MAGFGLPRTDRLRVERPVRNVDAADLIDERAALQLSRRQPLARIPPPNLLANLALGDLERQETLRADRCLDFLVVDERRRSAELTVLTDPLGIEDRDSLAALTLDGSFLGQPPTCFIRKIAQRLGEIVFDQRSGFLVQREWRGRAAKRADQKLFRRVPFRLRSAGGAGVFFESGNIRHQWRDRNGLLARYSSSALRLMRYDAPIFFAASSPDSMMVITSASGTPSACATSAGDNSSAAAGAATVAAGAPGFAAVAATGIPCCCMICWAIDRPTASSVAIPPELPPFSMPCAIWNFT